MKKLSIIIPCYNEEKALPFLMDRLDIESEKFNKIGVEFEIILIDDGSRDNTMGIIKEYQQKDARIHYISFSRNFGKEAAIYAGFQNCTGDFAVLMDADLQDPPEYLMDMYKAVTEEGFDAAATRRVNRKGEPVIRSFFARKFYMIMNKLTDVEIVDGARDFRMMKRVVIDAILQVGEYNRFSKGIYGWVGFKTKWFEYENTKRVAGESKWSFWSLLVYALDGIIAFSVTPLYLASILGLVMCMLSFLGILFIIIRQLLLHNSAYGWPSLVCIITLLGGVQLFCTGILGQYMAKTYMETKNRPKYIVRDKK